MELLGVLILIALPIVAYNIFLRDYHLKLLSSTDVSEKGELRGKLFKIATFVCFGVTIIFHLIVASLGAPALMWSIITIPLVFVINVIAILIIMEFVNRKHLRG